MRVSNEEIALVLAELTVLTRLDEGSPQAFRARAYENAVQAVRDYGGDIASLTEADLTGLKGIGKSTARKIREYVETGSIGKLETLRAEYPPAFVELTRIPGLGPKTLMLLRRELGIEDLDGLRAALEQEALRGLPGLGAKTEEKLAQAIERLGLHGKDRRTPIAQALPVAELIVAALAAAPGAIAVQYCGSLRRFRGTIGDVDIVASADQAAPVMDRFVGLSIASQVIAHGDTKSAIVTRDGIQVDLRVVRPNEFGAAVLYFTGSKAHNIELRQMALQRGWTLNEYSLSEVETGEVVASETEEEIYSALGLEYIPAPMREGAGEIAAATANDLPDLVTVEDIKGDLHHHTTLSGDGRSTADKTIAASEEWGLHYLAITDHGEDLAINGVSPERMNRQRSRLRRLQDRYPGMLLLHGCELNIGPEGGLDYDVDFRRLFDWCVASVHSHFDLDADAQTARLIAAIQDPTVNAIGHLSGRKIGRRPGIVFDTDAVLEAAVETGTAIEINGSLSRLDASVPVVRRGAELGVTFVISTDSHHVDELRRFTWGVLHAQRAWLEKDRVANTWPVERFADWAGLERR